MRRATLRRACAAAIAAAALVASVTGCTEGGAERESQPGPTDASPVSSSGPGTWDPTTWTPTVTITAASLSTEEKLASHERRLEKLAERDDLSPVPDVEIVRWIDSRVDYGSALAACMTDAGFRAEGDALGGVSFLEETPQSQAKAFNLAYYTCSAAYPLDPVFLTEWTADQLGLLYDYWEQYLVPCLAAHDVVVDQSRKPTREAYVARFHTAERTDWWPNDTLAMMPEDVRRAVEPSCPGYPPDAVFYGTS